MRGTPISKGKRTNVLRIAISISKGLTHREAEPCYVVAGCQVL